MRGELVRIKPELYSQLPVQAWLNRDNTIGVEFAGQKWIVLGAAGKPKATSVEEYPIVEIHGMPMSLVSIRRLARIIMDTEEEPVPILRYSECRIPVNVVKKMGGWSRPGPVQRRSRSY